jgi:valyl-tRNA synthetase
MALLMETVVAVRNLRSEMNVSPAREAPLTVRAGDHGTALYRETASYLRTLARVSDLAIGPDLAKPKHAASAVVGSAEVFVHLEGLIDLELERNRLSRELEKTENLVLSGKRKLENQDFLEKARPEVVEKEREKLAQLEMTLVKLGHALHALED